MPKEQVWCMVTNSNGSIEEVKIIQEFDNMNNLGIKRLTDGRYECLLQAEGYLHARSQMLTAIGDFK